VKKNADGTEEETRTTGNMIILVAPHVGFRQEKDSSTFTYGKITRYGQIVDTGACGAMMRFMGELEDHEDLQALEDRLARRESIITRYHTDDIFLLLQRECLELHPNLYEELAGLNSTNEKIIHLTKVNYEVVMRKTKIIIDHLLKKDVTFKGNIAVIGGVTINAPEEDYFVLNDIFYYLHDKNKHATKMRRLRKS